MNVSNSSAITLTILIFTWIAPSLIFVIKEVPMTPISVFNLSLYGMAIALMLFSKRRQIMSGHWAEFGTARMTKKEKAAYVVAYIILVFGAILTLSL